MEENKEISRLQKKTNTIGVGSGRGGGTYKEKHNTYEKNNIEKKRKKNKRRRRNTKNERKTRKKKNNKSSYPKTSDDTQKNATRAL